MTKHTRKLVETSIMLALATVLSLVKVFEAPFGGSVTAASMLPIIIIALRYGGGWGLVTGGIHGVIQLMLDLGKVAAWGLSPAVFIGSVFLDYLFAFGLLGVAGFFKNIKFGVQIGTFTAVALRFICHFFSGFILFAHFAPDNTAPLIYSLFYNGAFMLPELVITLLVISLTSIISRLSIFPKK